MVINGPRRNQKGFAQIELFFVLYVLGLVSLIVSFVLPDLARYNTSRSFDGYIPLDID
jgi:hypothetical protein